MGKVRIKIMDRVRLAILAKQDLILIADVLIAS